MSAPNTNIEQQRRRHRPALYAMVAVVAFAAVVFALNVGTAVEGEGPIVDPLVADDAQMLKTE